MQERVAQELTKNKRFWRPYPPVAPVPVCSRPARMFKMKRSIGRIWWDALGIRDIARHIGLSGIKVVSDQTELISASSRR
jgi:hypothetical protein